MPQRICPWWQAYLFDNPLRRLLHNPEQLFAELIGAGQTAVDLGCGMGYFSLALARMVGPSGRVIAVDLQPQMLKVLERRARRRRLLDRIQLFQCTEDRIGLELQADFVLAFWMVHEVPDPSTFLREIRDLLKPEAHFLLVEPTHHVTAEQFQNTLELAQASGLRSLKRLSLRISYAAVFIRG